MKKIAVLSAGNGGQALAADLALRGHDVALYDLPQFAPVIEAIRRRGNTIELQHKITGTAKIRLVTTDIAEALDGAEVVYFTAPSYGQKAFFDLAVPALSDGQVIVLMPGNYGTLALKAALREAGKDVLVAETDNLPYACAATEPGVVNVRGVKKAVPRWRPRWTGLSAPAGARARMCSPPACPGSIWSCTVRPCWPTPGALRARAGILSSITRG